MASLYVGKGNEAIHRSPFVRAVSQSVDCKIGVGCMTRDSDAQTQPEARSCVTVRSGLLRGPAQIG
jgi:hypothetical protein